MSLVFTLVMSRIEGPLPRAYLSNMMDGGPWTEVSRTHGAVLVGTILVEDEEWST